MDIVIIRQRIELCAHHFLAGVQQEAQNTREASIVVKKYISTGAITEDEEKILKTQLADTLKILGLGIPFVLIPGASIVMPILIKVAAKYKIDLLPSVARRDLPAAEKSLE